MDSGHGSDGPSLKDAVAFTSHGGALDAARRLFPKAPEPWLDLSTGINPIAYPVGALSTSAWTRLPHVTEVRALEAIAARRYGVAPAAAVVAAPGTQALIQRLPELCEGRDVRLLGPSTYAEFGRVFRAADRIVRVVPHLEAMAGADVAIVVNPNNPDGRLVAVPDLVALAGRVGALIVDEAFADALPPSHSIVPRLPVQRALVLRSFGKFYGLAGLRLGFAILPTDQSRRLRGLLGPWPVSGPAVAIGRAALADDGWHGASRKRLATDAGRLAYLLRQIGASDLGGTELFRLVAHPEAPALFTALARSGILVRPFEETPARLRFGLPGSHADWQRLTSALDAFR